MILEKAFKGLDIIIDPLEIKGFDGKNFLIMIADSKTGETSGLIIFEDKLYLQTDPKI